MITREMFVDVEVDSEMMRRVRSDILGLFSMGGFNSCTLEV